MREVIALEKTEKSKTGALSLFTLVTLAAGQVIGAGVVSTTGVAIAKTGSSVWLAYGAAVLLGLLLVFPVALFSSVVRFKGGNYAIVSSLLGEKWGGIYSLCYWLTLLSGNTICSALGSYIHAIFPMISIKLGGTALITVFYVLNLFGVKLMAGAQRIMTSILVAALLLFSIVGFGHLSPNAFDFSHPDFITNGTSGFLTAVVLLLGSCIGHSLVSAFSYNALKPKRDIPLAMFIASGIILVLYMAVSFVAGNVLPVSEVAGKPLTLVAKSILPGILYPLFIIAGPMLALCTTANSGYPSMTAPVHAGIRDGWMPKALAKTNKHDMPWILYTIKYILNVGPVLIGFNLQQLLGNLVMITNALKILVILAVFMMPKKFGEHWKKSWLYMPNWAFYPLMTICLVAQLAVIYLSSKTVPLSLIIMNIVVGILLVGYALYRYYTKKTSVNPIYSFED